MGKWGNATDDYRGAVALAGLELRASGVHCVGVAEVFASFLGFPCAECFGVGHSGMVGAELLEGFVVGAGICVAFAGHRVLRDVEQTQRWRICISDMRGGFGIA